MADAVLNAEEAGYEASSFTLHIHSSIYNIVLDLIGN